VHPGEGRGGWRGPIDLYLAVGGPQGTEPFHLVYGDYIDGRIWPLRRQDGHIENRLLAVSPTFITSFGEDESGEIYVLTSDGPTYVLEDIPSDAEPEQIPLTLSTSGLFSDITSQPVVGSESLLGQCPIVVRRRLQNPPDGFAESTTRRLLARRPVALSARHGVREELLPGDGEG